MLGGEARMGEVEGTHRKGGLYIILLTANRYFLIPSHLSRRQINPKAERWTGVTIFATGEA